MLKLIYYVPDSHLESTKQAIFSAGAGGIGNYEHCASERKSKGNLKGAANAKAVAKALKASHPYEEPAFEFIQIIEVDFN